MHRYVVGIAFHTDLRNVLLIRKNRPKWQSGMLNGPGGKVEPGEDFVEAMVREFREETGLEIPPDAWRTVVVYHGPDFELHFLTTTTPDLFKARTMTDEKLVFSSVEDVTHQNVLPNLRWVVPLCLDRLVEVPVVVRERVA